MKRLNLLISVLFLITFPAGAQLVEKDLPYVSDGHERQVLDIYAPPGQKIFPCSSGFTAADGNRATRPASTQNPSGF